MTPRICLPMLLLASAAALAETPLDFSGTWTAGTAASSDSSPSSPGSHGGNHGMGGGGHGGRGMGGGGMGGAHHGRHGQDSDSAAANTASAPADPRLHAHTLVIRQSDVVFDIAADGRRSAFRFDNRNNYGAQFGGTVMLSWSAPEMVIETHPDGGGSIEEHYALSVDGKTLTLHIRTQRAGEDTAREITRTFSRGDAAAPAGNVPTLP